MGRPIRDGLSKRPSLTRICVFFNCFVTGKGNDFKRNKTVFVCNMIISMVKKESSLLSV